MPQTLAQKLLAGHRTDKDAGLEPGAIVNCRVSLVLANDITGPLAVRSFKDMGASKVFDPARVVFVMDHFVPPKDIESANQVIISRKFAAEQGIHYFEGGDAGVEHAILPELGLAGPGDLIVGADSHTCTYGGVGAFATGMGSTDIAAAMALGESWFKVPASVQVNFSGTLPEYVLAKDLILWLISKIGVDGGRYKALEFTGSAIDSLSVESRLTMANMAVEAGAKVGLFPVDAKTLDYCRAAGRKDVKPLAADPGARYESVVSHNVSAMEPLVACPHIPENVRPVSQVKNVPINQVFIGSCTNGRIEDMRQAAAILKGRKVKKGLRCIVMPATPLVWKKALSEGLVDVFLSAGCVMGPASCGPCLGGHLGILGSGERAVSTSNRNFKGRMGSLDSEIYLANPAVAAASAVAGEVRGPGNL